METVLKNMLYDDGLQGLGADEATGNSGNKVAFPGMAALEMGMARLGGSVTRKGNLLVLDKQDGTCQTVVVRYNNSGTQSYGGVNREVLDQAPVIFAISRQTAERYTLCLRKAEEVKTGSWSCKKPEEQYTLENCVEKMIQLLGQGEKEYA